MSMMTAPQSASWISPRSSTTFFSTVDELDQVGRREGRLACPARTPCRSRRARSAWTCWWWPWSCPSRSVAASSSAIAWLSAAASAAPAAAVPPRSAGTQRSVSWTPSCQGSTICMTVLAAIALPAPSSGRRRGGMSSLMQPEPRPARPMRTANFACARMDLFLRQIEEVAGRRPAPRRAPGLVSGHARVGDLDLFACCRGSSRRCSPERVASVGIRGFFDGSIGLTRYGVTMMTRSVSRR